MRASESDDAALADTGETAPYEMTRRLAQSESTLAVRRAHRGLDHYSDHRGRRLRSQGILV
jgi:hypothetical protein